jgi:hypothetical protein
VVASQVIWSLRVSLAFGRTLKVCGCSTCGDPEGVGSRRDDDPTDRIHPTVADRYNTVRRSTVNSGMMYDPPQSGHGERDAPTLHGAVSALLPLDAPIAGC